VQNLLNNAVKYSPGGGEIVVRVTEQDDVVRISVADPGTGIADEAMPHIFDRFYRSPEATAKHTGGLGLGLAVAKLLVASHEGEITVDSQLGKGSTFTVTLPHNTAQETGNSWTE